MRPNRVIWTLCVCAVTVASAPAMASAPDAPRRGAHAVFPQPREAARSVEQAAREARQRQVRRREARRGPFLPIAAEPDYGTAENAFGAARSGHSHEGQDIFAPAGTPLLAVTDAEVAETGTDGAQGNYVYLYEPEADRTYIYMHMIGPSPLKQGEQVAAGDRVGGLGCTGSCWGDHLHFEVHAGRGIEAPAQDPMPLLQSWDRAPG